jgi:uncharacterized protein YbjT (DUF2867 family)
MSIVIFGATGFSGKAILEEVLAQNHPVTILVRNKAAVSLSHRNLTVLEGNVLDSAAVAGALNHCDAVIQCLGIGGKGTGKPTTFVSDANRIIIDEMEKQQIKRLIAMSNVGAGDSAAFQPWFFSKIILPYFMQWLKVIIDDKNKMEADIIDSKLDWTIVRCPNITDKPAKGYCNATLDGKGLRLSVTLGDMARFMAGQLTDRSYAGKAPCISN